LDYSTQSLISLEDEVDFLLQYVEMEQIRFKDAFVFQLELPDAADWTMIEVPPLVLQPYVENAIRHGLLPKAGKDKQIWLTIGLKEGYCHIYIRDNGIGRAAAQAARGGVDLLRTSRGMQISSDRFAGLSSTIFSDFRFAVNDLHDETGRPSGTEIHLSFQFFG
jgi:LytS/YehU family sensor histidine kinase